MDLAMVTETGDIPVPPRARWAKLTAAGSEEGHLAVLHVSGQASLHVEVDHDQVGHDGMVLVEWLFDEDDADGGH
jgi:hypothetical protein